MTKLALLIGLLFLTGPISARANSFDHGLVQIVQGEFGGFGEIGVDKFICSWDVQQPFELRINGIFGLGARSVPPEVCFSAIRLIMMKLPDYVIEGRKFVYETGVIEHRHYRARTEGGGYESVAKCRTITVKQPLDPITPEWEENIKAIFQKKGFSAGMREMEKLLDKNIQLECVFS